MIKRGETQVIFNWCFSEFQSHSPDPTGSELTFIGMEMKYFIGIGMRTKFHRYGPLCGRC